MFKKKKKVAAYLCSYAVAAEMQRVCNAADFTTKTPNVTPINAPYRVRVIEMVIEGTFGENIESKYVSHKF